MTVPVRPMTRLDGRRAEDARRDAREGAASCASSPNQALQARSSDGLPHRHDECFRSDRANLLWASLLRTAHAAWSALITFTLLLAGGPLAGARLAADDAAAAGKTVAVREVYVPADEPSAWPNGEWLARPTREYRQILSDLTGKDYAPPRASLGRVLYTATMDGSSFTNGRFTADVQLRGSAPAYISLGQPTCAFRHLEWEDRPAVWGLSPTGETLLRVRSHCGTLRGDWSLAGQPIFGRVEFEATLLPAVVSTLQLRLPASRQLTADAPVSVKVVPGSDPDWRTWILDLGQLSQIRMVVSEKPAKPGTTDQFAERVSRHSLTPDGLVLQSGFQVEGASAAKDQLVFDVSAGLEVTSVTLGKDLELPFQRVHDDEGARAAVVVPLEAVSLTGRAKLSVRGEMPLPSESRLLLPTISLRSFPLVSSRLEVTIGHPLELLDYAATRCRLIASTLTAQETDTLVFEDWAANSRVTVFWGVPRSDVVADVIAVVDAKHARPISRTLLKLTARSGSAYELTCDVPRDWQVTRVTSQPWHRLPQVSSWRTSSEADGSTQLWMEFRDSLAQNVPVFVEVWATRTTDQWPSSVDMPVVLPRASGLRHVHLAIQSPQGRAFTLPATSSYRPLKFPDMRDAWKDVIDDWDEWLGDPLTDPPPSAEPLYIAAETPSGSDTLQVIPTEQTATPTTEQQEQIGDSSRTVRRTGNGRSGSPAQSRVTAAIGESAAPEGPVLSGSLLADVTIATRVPAALESVCVQTASYRLRRPSIGVELQFGLPVPGELIAARVDGSEDHAVVTGQTAIVRIPSGDASVLIEIEYRVPFSHSLLRGTGTIPLPQSQLPAASLRWSVELPDSYRLGSSTSGTSLGFRETGWRQRLLGPLGLAPAEPAFWPFGTGSHSKDNDATPEPANRKTSAEESTTDAAAVDAADSAADTTGETTTAEPPDATLHVETRSVSFTAGELKLEILRHDKTQHLGWVLLVAALLTTTFMPSIPFLSHSLIRPGWVIATALVAALVPEALAVPCGGLFLGSFAGTLLPSRFPLRRVWGPGVSQPIGSTQMLAGAAAPLMVIALLATGDTFAYQPVANRGVAATVAAETGPVAKSDAEPKSAAGSKTAQVPAYDAMIPIRSGEPTLEETPVVYVSSALLSRWRATRTPSPETPPYLLREASYSIAADYLSRPRVTAIFDVVRPDPAAARQIVLPLRGIAFDDGTSCRVNGRKATVIPMRDDAGIMIDVADSVSGALPEDGPGDPGPGDFESNSLLRIELSFRPRSGDQRTSRRIEFEIPPLLSSVVDMGTFPAGIEPAVLNARGAGAPKNNEDFIQTELGPVARLEVDWSDAPQGAGNGAMAADLALSSVELHPRRLQVRTRLSFRTNPIADNRSLHTVEVQLPPGARLRDVRAPGLADSTAIRRDGLPTRLQLAFETLPADRIGVDIEYTLPAEMSGQVVRVPEFAFLPGGTADDFPRHLMALTASPGFQIGSRAAELVDEGIAPVTPSHFVQAWGEPDATVPDLMFSLTSPRSLDLPLTPLRPVVTAAVREILAVGRSRFVWEAEADVECQSVPIAVHRLSVDPRIRISSVRVEQDGADRLVRWSMTRPHEITLLLTEDFVGRQSIRVSGDFPFAINEPTDLPRFSLRDAQLAQHELEIRNPAGWAIETLNATGTLLENAPSVASDGQATPVADAAHRFDLLSDTPPAKVRVVETAATFNFERIVSIHAQENDLLQMRTLIRIPESAPLPPWIEFVVPADWARFGPLATPPELAPGSPGPNGGTLFILGTPPGSSPIRNVEFSVTFPRSEEPSWTVANIGLPQGSLSRQRLVLSGDCPFRVAGDARETPLDDDLRAMISLPEENAATPRISYSSGGGPWTFARGRPDGATSQITRIESAIWEIPPFGFAGITVADVAQGRAADVIVQIPVQLRLVQASWGGELLPLPPEGTRSLTVPATLTSRPRQPQQLRLWWKSRSPSSALRRTILLPRVTQLPVVSETVLFLGTDRSLYDSGGPWETLTEWQGLLTSSAALRPAEQPVSDALMAAGYAPKTSAPLASLSTSPSVLLRQRRDEPSGDEVSAVTVWAINRNLLRTVSVVVLGVLVVFLSWKTGLLTALQRYSVHRAACAWEGGTVLAALFWSMGPSAVGFCLLIVCGTGWALSVRRRWIAETGFFVATKSAP